jgi:hypothetical protein
MGGRKTFVTNTVLTAADVQDYLMDQSVMVFSNSTTRGSAIPTPTEGMVAYLTGTDSLEAYNGTAWTSAAGVSSGNAIINGGFDVWQRGTSFSTTDGYTADRWAFQNNKAGTVSQQTFTPGTAPVAGYEGRFFARVSTTATGSFANFFQKIEDVRTFAGQTVTLSFWAKSVSGTTTTGLLRLEQNFGTGGSSQETSNGSAITMTSSWQRFTQTFTLPSLAGKTISANDSFLAVVFPTVFPDATAMVYDIWGVQLEAGSVANPFRPNANSLQGELAACQRYYVEFGNATDSFKNIGMVTAESSTTAYGYLYPPVRMRVAPTGSASGTFAYNDIGTNRTVTLSIASQSGSNGDVVMIVATGTSFTGGRSGRLYSFSDANAKITLNSEL